MNPTNSSTVPAIIAAHNLLGRMLAAAQRGGDVGREWLTNGVRRLVGQAIAERLLAAGSARQIGVDCRAAQAIVAEAIADGVVDRREAKAIIAALAQPARTADTLAANLSVEGAS